MDWQWAKATARRANLERRSRVGTVGSARRVASNWVSPSAGRLFVCRPAATGTTSRRICPINALGARPDRTPAHQQTVRRRAQTGSSHESACGVGGDCSSCRGNHRARSERRRPRRRADELRESSEFASKLNESNFFFFSLVSDRRRACRSQLLFCLKHFRQKQQPSPSYSR